MTLVVNGERREAPEGATVADLLRALGIDGPRPVAVEVNRRVVARGAFDATALAADDRIEIVSLVGGG